MNLFCFSLFDLADDDKPVKGSQSNQKKLGSAGLALMETSKGRVAELYIDSTMPEYRGRGVQVALSKARLAEARKEGYDFATVQARQSNGSARNAERAGFGLAYCKPTFSKKTT